VDEHALLRQCLELASAYLDGLPRRPVRADASLAELRSALGGPMPREGMEPTRVLAAMARDADPGLVASAGPRYFGFVTGGSLPVALAADWLVSAWDQNAALYVMSPAAAVVEEVAAAWLLELFGLPASASVGFVTGCQMANFTGLAAARDAVLRRAGWDVEDAGLQGAPPIHILVGSEAHVTVLSALRMLGLGSRSVVRVAADNQGRMQPKELQTLLEAASGPVIVCAQAGNVNTGAFDPIDEIAALVHAREGWLHVDAAFGLWAAAASPGVCPDAAGLASADSWATDAHKWLNVPYDSGIAIVADAAAHRAALTARASYLLQSGGMGRDGLDWVPEASRRARAFPIYAALKTLGRRGVAQIVDRCCRLARRMAETLRAEPSVRVLNEVTLNQVVVRFDPPGGGDGDALTRGVIAAVQQEGTCWLGGARWHDREVMRISVSNWSTTESDVDRSAAAILAAARALKAS
jgi:glutamate/tyrosine decarboxylase-like PLP-dependent enzyme